MTDDGTVHVLPVQGSVYMLVGAGGNMAVQIGKDGVLVVDAKLAAQAEKTVDAIRQLSDKPIRYIVNTSADPDHTGGNQTLSRKAGHRITGGNEASAAAGWGATLVAHENVTTRMSDAGAPSEGWPMDTYFGEGKDLFTNGEAVQVIHQPAAHSDGDSLVTFFQQLRRRRYGRDFRAGSLPGHRRRQRGVDQRRGGWAQSDPGYYTVPADKQEGGTMVIPGHGPVVR